MRAFCVAAALLLAAGAARAQDYGHSVPWDDDPQGEGNVLTRGVVHTGQVRIRTSRPDCLLSAGFPVLRALVEPADSVERALVYFRPESYALWYQVPMKRSEQGFVAVLPKPRPSAQRVHFFVEVLAVGRQPARGPEQAVKVVEDRSQCGGIPAETVETAAIGLRVPKGAPALPPVPPGFEPVGTVSLARPIPRSRKAPLIVAGGFAAALGGLFAQGDPHHADTAGDNTPPNEVAFVDSSPPPDSHVSLSAAPQFTFHLRVRMRGGLGSGLLRATLLRSGQNVPCAVIEVPIGQFFPGATQNISVSGPLMQAQVCQPSDRLRLQVVQNGMVVAGTGASGPPDYPARYFIDP